MTVVAVIGASRNRRKFGNKAVRAFHRRGYHVVPVNPHAGEIEGLRAFATVADVPTAIDLVTLYLPPDIGQQVIATWRPWGSVSSGSTRAPTDPVSLPPRDATGLSLTSVAVLSRSGNRPRITSESPGGTR